MLRANESLVGAKGATDAILGVHPSMRGVREAIEKVAATSDAVLLRGETGCGKRLVASAIHAASPRARGPFVEIRCAGRDEGDAALAGRLREAQGGTVFLDEVSESSADLQGEILDLIESGPLRADARLVAASQRDLRSEVAAGRFREDLFHRLDAARIEIPALRERPCDIPVLAAAFLSRWAGRRGIRLEGFTPDALELLASYSWPGNVGELEDAIGSAASLAREPWIRPEHLRASLPARTARELGIAIPGSTLAEIERVAILRTLEAVAGSTSRAASMLGISTRKVQYRVREYREGGFLGGRLGSSRPVDP